MNGALAAGLTVVYSTMDWVDQQIAPMCLNDQALPVAHWTYPPTSGGGYAAGAVWTGVFAVLTAQDQAWIAAACRSPATFTFNDLLYGVSRGPCTAALSGLTLRITLSAFTQTGLNAGGFEFY
jgi:hypothetical protein